MAARTAASALALLLALAAEAGAAPAPPAPDPDRPSERPGPRWRFASWDLNADFTLGRVFPGPEEANFTAGFRAGALIAHEPWFWHVGPMVAVSNIDPVTTGVQIELLHLWSGVWVQVAPVVDLSHRVGLLFSGGWSILGAEAQVRVDRTGKPYGWVSCKIRLPFTLFAFLAR